MIYRREFAAFFDHLFHLPHVILIGDGFDGYGGSRVFQRGGDVALVELFITYGIPLGVAFFATIIFACSSAICAIVRQIISPEASAYLAFATLCLLFLVLSLAHYNTFFNKSVYVFLFLSLGLIRKFHHPERS